MYSTGNSTQYAVMIYMGKNLKKNEIYTYIYIYIYLKLNHFAVHLN